MSGNQGGVASPIILPAPTESSVTLRAKIAAHREHRPDMLKATAPGAPGHLYVEWQQWCAVLESLKTQLGMAEAAERYGWFDAAGNRIEPAKWSYGRDDPKRGPTIKAEPTAYVSEQCRKAEECKLYRERRAAGLAKMNGRPRSENPSKEALRCRERRAAKRVAA